MLHANWMFHAQLFQKTSLPGARFNFSNMKIAQCETESNFLQYINMSYNYLNDGDKENIKKHAEKISNFPIQTKTHRCTILEYTYPMVVYYDDNLVVNMVFTKYGILDNHPLDDKNWVALEVNKCEIETKDKKLYYSFEARDMVDNSVKRYKTCINTSN
jgi:hypothetical protein